MTTYRQRIYRVTIGTLQIGAPARVTFETERTAGHDPNKATVKIWNLSQDHQRQIEQSAAAQMLIDAGHESTGRGPERLFGGTVFRAPPGRQNAQPTVRTDVAALDAITHVEGRDGGVEYQQSRSAASYQPGVAFGTVLRGLVADLGVGIGNIEEAIRFAGERTFDEGIVVTGQTSRRITRLLAGVGLRWSVQRGLFQALRLGQPLETQILRLSPGDGGLIGSPEPGTRGRVSARAILTSDLWPGRALLLESARVQGRFTVRTMKDAFDSHGNDCHSDLELEAA